MGSAERGAFFSGRGRRSAFLRLFVLGTGIGVMAVEFAGERLIQPFFGSSEFVWAVLIGLILFALAVGYALGGRLADRNPSPVLLGGVVVAAGVYVALLPLLAEPFLAAVSHGLLASPAGVVLASLAGVSVLFIPPVAALGIVSPFAVRLAIERAEEAGERAGSLYAWSTFGSLAGTFLPTFWTIPTYGVRATLYLSAALLIVLGAIMAARLVLAALVLVPLLVPHALPALLKPVPNLVAEVETPYQFAQVYRVGQDTLLSVNDAAGFQSVWTPRRLTGLYYDDYLTLPFAFPPKEPLNALLIGMAAGTIPTLYARDVDPYRAGVTMTGVEIDPALIALGRRYFHLEPGTVRVAIGDGRVFLAADHASYNLIIVDAYAQEIYIPFHLATREFFAIVRAHLLPGGMLAMNVNATSPRSPLLQDMERTLADVFSHVAVARAEGPYNYLLIASESPLRPVPGTAVPPFLKGTADRLRASWHEARPGPGLILTDDRAPIEMLTNQMIVKKLLGQI